MAGTSALLRSAASVRNQLATYQDSLMAYEYSNSAYTDSALSSYQAYLQTRISSLNATPSISAASKALALTKTMEGATKSNISATIQRENIQVLSGNATPTDKYNVISQQFMRAQSIGDMTLAQSLEGQAYSLSQTIQSQQQTAAAAFATQSTAAAKLNAKSALDVGTSLKTQLDSFNTNYANAGRKTATSVIADFVKSITPTLNTLGIHLQPGVQPNYFDIVDGVNRAMYKSFQNASTIVAPYDSSTAQTYADKANAVIASVPTIYGSMNTQQLAQAQANPNQFTYAEDPQFVSKTQSDIGGKLNPQTGYQQTANGVQPTFSQSPWLDIGNNLNNQIQSLKLKVITTAGNGTEVTASDQSPAWVKQIIPSDGTVHLLSGAKDAQGNSQLQFEADAQHGTGKAIYTIAKDNTVWESSNLGDRLISGTPQSQQQPTSMFGKVGEAFMSGMKSVSTMLMGHASADGLPSYMLNQSTNHYTLPPIPVVKPMQLPPLSVAPAQAQPQLHNAPAINAYPSAPTANPQNAAPGTAVQSGGSGISVQGGNSGGMALQGGGGGGFSLQ